MGDVKAVNYTNHIHNTIRYFVTKGVQLAPALCSIKVCASGSRAEMRDRIRVLQFLNLL